MVTYEVCEICFDVDLFNIPYLILSLLHSIHQMYLLPSKSTYFQIAHLKNTANGLILGAISL